MFAERFFFQEFAELAFALARSDGSSNALEIVEFNRVMRKEFLGKDWYPSDDRYDLLTGTTVPPINEAFNNVIHVLKLNKDSLTEEDIERYIFVLRRVAEVFGGIEEIEDFIVERFKTELKRILT